MNLKKAALEMSIGTIVVIVLAMTMLILGLILVRTIFSGAKYNVETMNEKVKGEINKLFTEENKIVVYLPDNLAEIDKEKSFGVAFGIKNLNRGSSEASEFKYEVLVDDDEVKEKCDIGEKEVEEWIETGKSGSMDLAPGEFSATRIRFEIPQEAPLCTVRFKIGVSNEGKKYSSEFFDVRTK